MLGRFIVLRTGESLDADEIVLRSVVNRLGGLQVPGEGAGDRQHVRQKAVLGIKFAMFVTSPRPARPSLEEKVLGGAGQIALEILRRVHRVDGVLDGTTLGIEAVAGLVPDADGEKGVERDRLALHQRVNFLHLLFHDGEQGNFLFAGVVAGHAVVLFFLLVDFLRNRERINIHGDGVIEQPEIGEALNDAGIGRARPAGQDDDRVIMAVEEEAEIGLAAAFAVPAIFLNGKLRFKPVRRVVIEPVIERRIQKPFVMPEMVKVGHGEDARTAGAEDFKQQPVNMVELGFKLVEQRVIVVAAGGGGLERLRHILQRARDVEDDALPAEFAFCHGLPVAREAFVAGALGPDVGKLLRLLLVAQQFPLVIGIAEVLHLQPLVLVKRGEQETELILKIVEVGNLAVGEVGRFKDKPLRHEATAPELIEDNQIADKYTIGSAFKHRSDMD